MKKSNAAIAADNAAFRRLDRLIEEDSPLKKEPGGTAYAPRDKSEMKVASMYNVKDTSKRHIMHSGAVHAVVTIIILVVVAVVIAVAIKI